MENRNREYNNDGNTGNSSGDRGGRDYQPKRYNYPPSPVKNNVFPNSNQVKSENTHPNTPRIEKRQQTTIKPKASMKDEVLELVDSGELSEDVKAMCLAMLHVANKIEHAARVIEEFTKQVKEEKVNEKVPEVKTEG